MGLYIVTGPPASGKTTWVRERAQPGDIVIDYDFLAAALTAPGADAHDHAKVVKKVAFRARSAAVREALRHTADVDVYVIHSLPAADAMATYAEHNARLITIDPGRDIVMARISEQRPASMIAVAERWYAKHRHMPPTQPAQPVASRRW